MLEPLPAAKPLQSAVSLAGDLGTPGAHPGRLHHSWLALWMLRAGFGPWNSEPSTGDKELLLSLPLFLHPIDIDECQEYGAALCGAQRCENSAGSYRCVVACQAGYRTSAAGDCVGEFCQGCAKRAGC